mgnify:CR=1 FL=1
MDIPYKKIFQFLYGPFFYVIDFFMRHYKANRERLDAVLGRKKIAAFLQNMTVVILIVWILVFTFSSEESRDRLTREMQESFQKLKNINQK